MVQTPTHLTGLRRDGIDDTLWRTTVGEIAQYRTAYGIDSQNPLGARPSYDDATRVDQYRQLEHDLNRLSPMHGRHREIAKGIEH